MTATARRSAGALLVLAALLTGCSSAQPVDPTPSPDRNSSVSGDVTVFAAASLSDAFAALALAFQAVQTEVNVNLNFGGSSMLAEQILQGAPADVFASADRATMRRVVEAGAADHDELFATNVLELVVAPGNPAGIRGLADLQRSDLAIALCAADVPCGAATRRALAVAGITPRPDTLEQDVKSVLTRVRLGEADVGVVYRTDVSSAERDVDGVPFPEAASAVNEYPIASLTDAPHPEAAEAFVAFVLSGPARAILDEAGFGAP